MLTRLVRALAGQRKARRLKRALVVETIANEGLSIMIRLQATYKQARELNNFGYCSIPDGYIVLDGSEPDLLKAVSTAREVRTEDEARQLANFLTAAKMVRQGRDLELEVCVLREIGEMPFRLARVALI